MAYRCHNKQTKKKCGQSLPIETRMHVGVFTKVKGQHNFRRSKCNKFKDKMKEITVRRKKREEGLCQVSQRHFLQSSEVLSSWSM